MLRLGIKFDVPELCWVLVPASAEKTLHVNLSATNLPSGEPANDTGTQGSPGYLRIPDKTIQGVTWGLRPCNGRSSSNLLVWSLWPKGCTLPTGPVMTWLVRP